MSEYWPTQFWEVPGYSLAQITPFDPTIAFKRFFSLHISLGLKLDLGLSKNASNTMYLNYVFQSEYTSIRPEYIDRSIIFLATDP